MPNERTFKLVVGVHRETPVPDDVRTLHLCHRTALVLDTCRSWSPDMYFDAGLLVTLLDPINRFLDAAGAFAVRLYEPERLHVCGSLAALAAFYSGRPADAGMPEHAAWTRGRHTVARGFSERWDLVGGPALYHDSCTFSIFTGAPLPEAVLSHIRAAGSSIGAEMSELAYGDRVVA